MNNVKENEWKEIEKLEESVMVKVFKTLRSCSRHLLYLEAGVVPARYQVMRQMMNFLQYILMQPPNSLLHRFYQAQIKNPNKGDWASEAKQIANHLNIHLSYEKIQNMKRTQFKQQSGEKGKKIKYEKFQMSDYLLAESKATLQ